MSYMNQNKVYGSKFLNEKYYNQGNCNQPYQENCNQPHQGNCNQVSCNDQCCNENHPKNNCDEECPVEDNCCTGGSCPNSSCVYNPSKAKCICTYLDVVYDEKNAVGSTVLNPITTNATDYLINAKYEANNGCCTPCTIDETSVFTIESAKVTIKSFLLNNQVITPNLVLVDGLPVLSITPVGNGYTAIVDPAVIDNKCSCQNLGSKASVLLTDIGPWNYIAKYDLCGKVTTGGNTCKFHITIENLPTVPGTIVDLSTFVAPEVCLPPQKQGQPINLDIQFLGIGQIINPTLTFVQATQSVVLTATLMLNAQANLRIMENTKVCFNAML